MTDRSDDTPRNSGQVPQKHGGRLNAGGKKGNKGGTGRPSNALRIRLDAIAQKFLKSGDSLDVAGNPDHPRWLGLGQFATEHAAAHAYGKPAQEVKVEGEVSIKVERGLNLKVTHE